MFQNWYCVELSEPQLDLKAKDGKFNLTKQPSYTESNLLFINKKLLICY